MLGKKSNLTGKKKKTYTVKPHNGWQLKQLDFFPYCGVFHYFEDSEALSRAFWGQNLSAFAGIFAILTSAIASFTVHQKYTFTQIFPAWNLDVH